MEWERAVAQQPPGWAVEREETFEWITELDGVVGEVTACVDGSMFDAFDERFTTLGWAFLVMKEGRALGVARGTLPRYVRGACHGDRKNRDWDVCDLFKSLARQHLSCVFVLRVRFCSWLPKHKLLTNV